MIIAAYFIVALVMAVIQYSFLAFWPATHYVMPLLIIALFATVAHRPAVSFAVVAWCGLMLDWYSSTVIGFNVLVLCLTWLIIIFTMKRFFTNLSLLSGLAMMALSVILFRFMSWIFIMILNALNFLPVRIIADKDWLISGLWMALINSALFGILFFGANRISRIFNFAFINKR